MDQTVDFDVVIVGGGIAGIAAARALHKQSQLTWCILEASGKLGGRIQSVILDGCRVDTGAYELASFLQKRTKQNSLYSLINQGFCQLNFRQTMNKVYYYQDNGTQYSQESINKVARTVQQLSVDVKEWVKVEASLSVEHCVKRFQKEGKLGGLTDDQRRLFELFILMEEQEQAADGDDLAADSFFADDEMEEDDLDTYPLPAITYQGLLHKLINELPPKNIMLDSPVQTIQFKSNHCQISLKSNKDKKITARYAICAVPLSVVKSKAINFVPQLPDNHLFIFDNLGYGYMEKVILAFEEPFWPEDAQRIKIASDTKGKFPHFSNLSGPKSNPNSSPNPNSHILCCYLTASHAKQLLSGNTNEQIISQALQHLQKTFPNKSIKLKDAHVTRWMDVRNIWGSFSYIRPNLRYNTAKEVRLPVSGRLWFVGQYCYPENIGCAHGAYETGWQAATSIINQSKHPI